MITLIDHGGVPLIKPDETAVVQKFSRLYQLLWLYYADNWTAISPVIPPPPNGIAVNCNACWDLNMCCECLGEYPEHCPAECGDGTCFVCRGGAA